MITEGDLEKELRKLYLDTHPEREKGEFTISEYAKVNHLTMQQAENDLEYKTRQGHLIKNPEKKYIDFKLRTVYKMLPKKQDHL